jgi:hypothetical protein
MKKLFLVASLGLLGLASSGQSFQKNDLILSGGLGRSIFALGNWSTYQSIPGFSSTLFQPITLKAEFALSNEIGLGFSTVYSAASARWQDQGYSYESSYNKLSITPRLNIHFLRKKVLDMYVGGGLGYKTGEYLFKSNDPSFAPVSSIGVIPISLEASLGMRAYITPDLGAFAEFGAGHGYLHFGVVYKPLARTRND